MTTSGFTSSQEALILTRDPYCLMRCGRASVVANHRGNRGSGGYRGANTVANGCGLCWQCNGLIESDAELAYKARLFGVKISKHADPTTKPVLRIVEGPVYYDDEGSWTPC